MKKRVPTIVGIFALILLLAGAAFVGGQLIEAQQQAQGEKNMQDEPRKLVTPAAGVPITEADARGDITTRDGNSIMVCDTASINPNHKPNHQPEVPANDSNTESPTNQNCLSEFEVVITHDTVLLHDVTSRQYGSATKPASGEDTIMNQVVEPGTLDDIGVGTRVFVWGRRSGNRIVADTLLYRMIGK
jgi:hypothetical protein